MRKIEIKIKARVTAVEIEPKNWWSERILRLAKWSYKLDFKPLVEPRIEEMPFHRELTDEEENILKGGNCPMCGSEHFFEGPHGGNAVNIFCENGHRFWYAPPFPSEYQGHEEVRRDGKMLQVVATGFTYKRFTLP